jgi:hypothetical protein
MELSSSGYLANRIAFEEQIDPAALSAPSAGYQARSHAIENPRLEAECDWNSEIAHAAAVYAECRAQVTGCDSMIGAIR